MPRVAVIAVHGVADQQPGATNRAIADLLANIDAPGAGPAYGPFTTATIRLPVQPVPVPSAEMLAGQSFDALAAQARRQPTDGRLPADIQFTASLLAEYQGGGPDDTYDTSVVSAHRVGPTPADARDVDVFEMYWADLSRLTQAWWRVFAEVYQLLFHLASLGVHAINAASLTESAAAPRLWSSWAATQRSASNLLARDTVFLNLYLAGLVVTLSAARPSAITAATLTGALVGVGAAVGASGWCFRHSALRNPTGWAAGLSLLAGGAAFAFGYWLAHQGDVARAVLATVLALVAGLGIALLARAYEVTRPGAKACALIYGLALAVALLSEVWWPIRHVHAGLPSALLHTAELAYFTLRVVWLWLILQMAWAFIVGAGVWYAAAPAARERIGRLQWTARLTLALPALVFLLLTTVLWTVVAASFGSREAATSHEPLAITRWLLHGVMEPGSVVPVVDRLATMADTVRALMINATGPGFTTLVIAVALAVLVLVLVMVPSLYGELRPPRQPRDGTRLGVWLDSGFPLARWAGRVVVFGFMLVLPGALVFEWFVDKTTLGWWLGLTDWNLTVLYFVATAVGAGGVGLVVFGNRLKKITLGFRGVVDVLLDVDNYLRQRPRGATPRARIFARMAALLRHVSAQGYDSIVILAHSQGTVITTDLLRFLRVLDALGIDAHVFGSTRPPVRLFTMGSPLRQLYGLRFPHLYDWVRHSHRHADADHACAVIPPGRAPDPEGLGLAQWVNAYRSGDYVGRYLWRTDQCPSRYATPLVDLPSRWPAGPFAASASVSPETPPLRREFCVGAGAHTRYWHRSAPQIALELDALISAALSGASARAD